MPTSDPPASVVRWLSRIPGEVFMASIALLLSLLGAIGIAGLKFAWSINNRMTRVEVLVDAIADHVGVDDTRQARR